MIRNAQMLLLIVIFDGHVLDHVEPSATAELRAALALVLEPKLLVVRDHVLVGNESSAVNDILLSQSVEVGFQERRPEAFALKVRQNSERVDGGCAAFLLVTQCRVG